MREPPVWANSPLDGTARLHRAALAQSDQNRYTRRRLESLR